MAKIKLEIEHDRPDQLERVVKLFKAKLPKGAKVKEIKRQPRKKRVEVSDDE